MSDDDRTGDLRSRSWPSDQGPLVESRNEAWLTRQRAARPITHHPRAAVSLASDEIGERLAFSYEYESSAAVDHHLGRPRPRVVVGRHAHPVCAGRHDGEKSPSRAGRRRSPAEEIAASRISGPRRRTSPAPRPRDTGRTSCHASYSAGRMRSFMAASTTAKLRSSPRLTYSTRSAAARVPRQQTGRARR